MSSTLGSIERLRAAQAKRVMPCVGAILDAWEGTPNDVKGVLRFDYPHLCSLIEALNRAVEGE